MAFKRVEPLRGDHCDTGQVGMPKQHELFPLHEELLPPLFSKAMGIPSAPGVRFYDSARRWPVARRPESSLHVSPSAFREPALRRPPTTADLMAGMATSTGAGQPSGVSATGPGATARAHRHSGEPSLAPMAPSVSHDTLRESSENASLMHLAANMQTGVPSILGPGGDSTFPRPLALDRSSPLASGPPSSNPRSEDEDEALALRPTKKSRLVWTEALHDRFIKAVDKCGGLERAVPKRIMEEMGLSGLTRENVASHLQKYRLYLKRGKCGDQKSRQSKG